MPQSWADLTQLLDRMLDCRDLVCRPRRLAFRYGLRMPEHVVRRAGVGGGDGSQRLPPGAGTASLPRFAVWGHTDRLSRVSRSVDRFAVVQCNPEGSGELRGHPRPTHGPPAGISDLAHVDRPRDRAVTVPFGTPGARGRGTRRLATPIRGRDQMPGLCSPGCFAHPLHQHSSERQLQGAGAGGGRRRQAEGWRRPGSPSFSTSFPNSFHSGLERRLEEESPWQNQRLAGDPSEPSDGLEPSTPSLPWKCSTS